MRLGSSRPLGGAPERWLTLVAAIASVGVGVLLGTGRTVEVLVLLAGAVICGSALALGEGIGQMADRLAYGTVCGAVALISWNGVRVGNNVTASDLLLALSVCLAALGLIRSRDRFPLHGLVGPLAVGTGLIIMSALLAEMLAPAIESGVLLDELKPINAATGAVPQGVGGNIVVAARLVAALVGVPLLIAVVCTRYGQIDRLGTVWVGGVAMSCLVAVVSAFTAFDLESLITGKQYVYGRAAGEALRHTGLTLHPNHLGIAASLAAPLALVRLRSGAVVYAPIVALYALAIVISGSRLAVAVLLLAVALIAVTQPATRRPIIVIAIVAGALSWRYFGSADLALIDRLQDASASATDSDTTRQAVLSESLRLFQTQPVVGYGFDVLRGAHNLVLQLLTAGGVLAFIGYAVVLWTFLERGWSVLRSGSLPPATHTLVVGCLASVGVSLLSSMASNQIIDRYVYVPVALIVAGAMIHAGEPGVQRPASVRSGSVSRLHRPAPSWPA